MRHFWLAFSQHAKLNFVFSIVFVGLLFPRLFAHASVSSFSSAPNSCYFAPSYRLIANSTQPFLYQRVILPGDPIWACVWNKHHGGSCRKAEEGGRKVCACSDEVSKYQGCDARHRDYRSQCCVVHGKVVKRANPQSSHYEENSSFFFFF